MALVDARRTRACELTQGQRILSHLGGRNVRVDCQDRRRPAPEIARYRCTRQLGAHGRAPPHGPSTERPKRQRPLVAHTLVLVHAGAVGRGPAVFGHPAAGHLDHELVGRVPTICSAARRREGRFAQKRARHLIDHVNDSSVRLVACRDVCADDDAVERSFGGKQEVLEGGVIIIQLKHGWTGVCTDSGDQRGCRALACEWHHMPAAHDSDHGRVAHLDAEAARETRMVSHTDLCDEHPLRAHRARHLLVCWRKPLADLAPWRIEPQQHDCVLA
mmetsp:Transcript_14251/g.36923  ORF Transcript_14251/g.36923 Transcript_14251/m.36923 type:complete len:274 (-) Transcript_14251:179-1000(-)